MIDGHNIKYNKKSEQSTGHHLGGIDLWDRNPVFFIFWVLHVIGKSDQHFGGTCCHLLQHQSSSKKSVIFNTLRVEYDILFIKMAVQ
jgi:hypothetical protein